MIPPNLKDVVMPCCCINCNNYTESKYREVSNFCCKYGIEVEYNQVCNSWDSIEYGN